MPKDLGFAFGMSKAGRVRRQERLGPPTDFQRLFYPGPSSRGGKKPRMSVKNVLSAVPSYCVGRGPSTRAGEELARPDWKKGCPGEEGKKGQEDCHQSPLTRKYHQIHSLHPLSPAEWPTRTRKDSREQKAPQALGTAGPPTLKQPAALPSGKEVATPQEAALGYTLADHSSRVG